MTPTGKESKVLDALHALMGKREFLQGKGLGGRVAAKCGIDPVEAKLALGKLARNGILDGVSHQGEAFGRVMLLVAAPVKAEPTSLTRWRAATRAIGLADGETEALAPCHDRLEGFIDADLRELANGLMALRAAQVQEHGTPRFVVSAKYLLGSSKLIGSLPPAALKAFGIEMEAFPDAIPHILVAGPAAPEAVILIENPHSFEEAVAAGCAEIFALVVTYGYGLSRSGEQFGNRLVESVDATERLVPLVRSGNPPRPAELFRHPRIFFWGDLDREGLRIYASLRSRIPALRISALYRPMSEAARQGQSHPYVKATAKDGQAALGTMPDDALPLVPLCCDRGVDQEIVARADIAALIALPLAETTP
jgi:hypothetical protein